MSKFTIRCTKSDNDRFEVGKLYYVDEKGCLIDEHGEKSSSHDTTTFKEWYDDCFWRNYAFELVKSPSDEIHITTKGNRTIAVKKQNGKVIKRAEAICAPSDMFDFNTGAQLAFNRLVYGTDYNPAEVKLTPTEDKPEPIKLYCVKDHPDIVTKGKVYELPDFVSDYCAEKGIKASHYDDFSDFSKINPDIAPCLVPLVARPAKVGEWVLITSDKVCGTEKGEICEVVAINDASPDNRPYLRTKEKTIFGYSSIEPCTLAKHSDYLVLDGYQPEPEYYSGKVICVDTGVAAGVTVGKVYNVQDGVFLDDMGRTVPKHFKPFTSLEDMNRKCGNYSGSKFIEFVEG